MRSRILVRLIVACTILILPMPAHAQEAAVSGTVTDSSGGVLPGVTIRAVHEATGNAFDTVTDERGAYRLAVRVGTVRIMAELQGFSAVARAVELLVGQTALVNLQMSPVGIAETVTVTGAAPLIEMTTSVIGGNVDPRQVTIGDFERFPPLTEQNISGPAITASYAATNAEIAPSLGRNLGACGTRTPCTGTATIPLVVPGTQFEGRTTRLDLRATKIVRVSDRLRLQLNMDLYNALNASDILSITTNFGARWRQPTQILDPRIMQFSGQLTF